MPKLLIFEDNLKFLSALRLILSEVEGLEIVATYENADQASEKVTLHQPDLILMDIEMPPGKNGIEATLDIRRDHPTAKIVMLTVLNELPQITAAIQAGASGYLIKSSTGTEIVQKITEALASEGRVVSPSVVEKMFEMVEKEASESFPPNHFDLSKREREVLCLLVEGKKQHEIAQKLFIAETTVNDHMKAIYRKLKVDSQLKAMRVALKFRICDT